MDIGNGNALGVDGEAADLDVFADDQHHLLLLLGNGQVGAVVLALHQSVQIGGLVGGDGGGDALDEVHELLVLGDEVGLGVDLDHNAHAVDGGGISHALGSDAAGLLLRSGQTLFTQDLDSLVKIAVGLGQSLLTIHHAHAGGLAQVFHVSSGKCHILFPPMNLIFQK